MVTADAVILQFIIRNIYMYMYFLVFAHCFWLRKLVIFYVRAIGASFVIILGLLPSVPEMLQSHAGEMGALLLTTCPFQLQPSLCQ